MGGYCAARRAALIPGANSKLKGAVPAGAVVSVYGAPLHKQAAEELLADGRGGPVLHPPIRGMTGSVAADKRALRTRARQRRAAAPRDAGAGSAAARNFLAAIDPEPGCVVSGYWPLAGELDARPLMVALHERGHVCALPVVAGKGCPLAFRVWRPGATLEPAVFGTSVPLEDAPEVSPRVVLVPFLAFDGRGFRLGHGAGYYDRTLAALRAGGRPVLAVGLGFAAERVESVPTDASDERLDWVVTEQRAMKIG